MESFGIVTWWDEFFFIWWNSPESIPRVLSPVVFLCPLGRGLHGTDAPRSIHPLKAIWVICSFSSTKATTTVHRFLQGLKFHFSKCPNVHLMGAQLYKKLQTVFPSRCSVSHPPAPNKRRPSSPAPTGQHSVFLYFFLNFRYSSRYVVTT